MQARPISFLALRFLLIFLIAAFQVDAAAEILGIPDENETAKLVPSDPDDPGYLDAVATNGTEALVRGPTPEFGGIAGGSVFAFVRAPDGNWNESQTLTPSDPRVVRNFGSAIAVDGETAVIAAGDSQHDNAGYAYVFQRTPGGLWEEVFSDRLELRITDVDVSGHTAIVAGIDRSGPIDLHKGYVYVYEEYPSGWTRTQALTSGREGDLFAASLSVMDDALVVGAHRGDGVNPRSGIAYVYRKDAPGAWVLDQTLLSAKAPSDSGFGGSVALGSNYVLVGAASEDLLGSWDVGSAYIFGRNSRGRWIEEAKLLPPYEGTQVPIEAEFGWAVAIEGETAYICEDQGRYALGEGGNAWVFKRQSEGAWKPVSRLIPSDTQEADYFCNDIDVEMGTVVAGSNDLGGAYVFEHPGFGQPMEVEIDVLPWREPNAVDPGSTRLVPAAIYGSGNFDALQCDHRSIRLNPGDARARNYRVIDTNRDGFMDLLTYFRSRDIRVGCGQTEVELTGKTHDGFEFYGTDVVRNRRCPK